MIKSDTSVFVMYQYVYDVLKCYFRQYISWIQHFEMYQSYTSIYAMYLNTRDVSEIETRYIRLSGRFEMYSNFIKFKRFL